MDGKMQPQLYNKIPNPNHGSDYPNEGNQDSPPFND